ncbi:MAG: M3 family oligoendopeptidase [Candidatus Bathyarchaeota archaeon]|jgi:oligoendopeptidase F
MFQYLPEWMARERCERGTRLSGGEIREAGLYDLVKTDCYAGTTPSGGRRRTSPILGLSQQQIKLSTPMSVQVTLMGEQGNEMVWDLSQLVENTDPGTVKAKLKEGVDAAEELRKRYHSKIESLDAVGLLRLLEERDDFTVEYEGATKYCRLKYAENSTDETAKTLNDAVRTAMTRVGHTLAFIDLELGRLLAEKPGLIDELPLAEYRHYLEKILRRVPYMLSEEEEKLTIVKDKNGIDSWQMLQGDWLSTRTFEIEVEGEKKTLTYGEIIGLYESPNRGLREAANQTVYESLGVDEIIWSSAIRAICSDHLEMCEVRGYPSPMEQSLVANDVDKETIDALMRTIENNVNLYRRYLRIKARLMGLDRLGNWDIVAPLPQAPEKEYTWTESREEVVGAYSSFDSQFADWVKEMYARRHIDGEIRKGKATGAFCASWFAGKSAYILQSFNGRMGDIYTQAHELGHAVHAYLGSRHQKPSNYEIGSCIAECGSNFAELILTDKLLGKAESLDEKQVILANILDDFGMSAFQVSARTFFEQGMYDAIKEGKFLDGETVAELWTRARDKIYGDAVEWLDVMKWEWTMKVHYYLANYRFYNYPYVFAKLFVFGLYRLYKEQGREFVPKLRALLVAGSSKSPRQLGLDLGFDIREEEFWERGMDQAREFIERLEETLEP